LAAVGGACKRKLHQMEDQDNGKEKLVHLRPFLLSVFPG
jgi:hypothetical protein